MKKEYIELKPILDPKSEWDELEARLKKLFRDKIYYPLLKELDLSKKTLKNAKNRAPLMEALFTGQITFNKGVFSGSFNAGISQALRDLGATFDRKTSTYRIAQADLPMEVRNMISASSDQFQSKIDLINQKLKELVPEDIAKELKSADLFDRALWKTEKSFQTNVKNITVAPKLTEAQSAKIAEEWQNNMQLYIKDFTEKQIQELRETVLKSTFEGNRWGSLVDTIQKSYKVSANKAKFLARQETQLLLTTHKVIKYKQAGVTEYSWRTVNRPKDPTPHHHTLGNVRYSHGILDKTIQRFDAPPIVSNPGEPVRRANPGADYNCFPESTLITLDRPINKIFKRRFTGELSKLIYDGGFIESTKNHPILTQRGWIASQDIQIGDYVFKSREESISGFELDSKNMKSSVEQIFDSILQFGQISLGSTSKSDFHGDVIEDEHVDIISSNNELSLNRIIEAFEILSQFIFKSAHSSGLTHSHFLNRFKAMRLSSSGLISLLGHCYSFLRAQLTSEQLISLCLSSNVDSCIFEPSENNSSIESIFDTNGISAQSFFIILNCFVSQLDVFKNEVLVAGINTSDLEVFSKSIFPNLEFKPNINHAQIGRFIKPLRVIDKSFRNFSGHVYNLETSNNWFYANGIISHNCRCYAVPLVSFRKEES